MDTMQIIFKNVVLSTLHGWVGASLAVFMFFRPLKPWRIGRIRIWQGVIPAQQQQIAEAVSEVVASELITPGALHDYLVQSRVLDSQVRSAVAGLVTAVADREYPTVDAMIPATAAGLKDELKELIKKTLAARAEEFLTKPEVAAWLEHFLHHQLSRLWGKKLGELWPEEQAGAFCSSLPGSLLGYLEDPGFKETLWALLEEQYQALCGLETPLGEVLPGPVREKIGEWPARLVQVLPVLVQRLRDNEELLGKLTEVILDTMEQLKEKGLLARIGIDLYQFFNNYKRDIRIFVKQEMFPRLAGFLSSAEVQAWLERYIREQTDRLLEQPAGELARGLSREQLARTKDWLEENLREWAASPAVQDWLKEFIMERYRRLAGYPLADLADRYAGLRLEEVEKMLARQGFELMRQPATLRFVRLSARSLVEAFASYPVGRLRNRLHPDTLEKVEAAVADLVIAYLQSQIPAFLGGLDIKGIARTKIEGYSPKELVDMFRQVTMNNMQKIEIYGALIGAFMGVFFGLANLRGDAFWLISAALLLAAGLIRWGSRN